MTAETGVKYYPLPRNGRYAGQLEEHLRSLGLPEPLARTMSESVHQFTQKGDYLPRVVVGLGSEVSLIWVSDRTVLPAGAFLLELGPKKMSFRSTRVGRTVDVLDLGLPEACSIEKTGSDEGILTFEGNMGSVHLRKNRLGNVTIKTEKKVG